MRSSIMPLTCFASVMFTTYVALSGLVNQLVSYRRSVFVKIVVDLTVLEVKVGLGPLSPVFVVLTGIGPSGGQISYSLLQVNSRETPRLFNTTNITNTTTTLTIRYNVKELKSLEIITTTFLCHSEQLSYKMH